MSDPIRALAQQANVTLGKTLTEQEAKLKLLKDSIDIAEKLGEPVTQQRAALASLETIVRELRKTLTVLAV